MTPAQLVLVGAGAAAAGVVNAIAGGGTLLSFPALLACGVPPVQASLTNTIALCPGYLGATVAQRRELAGQGRRLALAVPAAGVGGAAGALLLLRTGDAGFAVVVPPLLVLAAVLLALQPRLAARLRARPAAGGAGGAGGVRGALAVAAPVGLAAIYGGYFGAGLGVILLAGLAVVTGDSLARVSALKQVASLATNVAAAAWFVARAHFDGTTVLVMAVASLVGGAFGGALASRVPAGVLRALVVVIGLAVAAVYAAKLVA